MPDDELNTVINENDPIERGSYRTANVANINNI